MKFVGAIGVVCPYDGLTNEVGGQFRNQFVDETRNKGFWSYRKCEISNRCAVAVGHEQAQICRMFHRVSDRDSQTLSIPLIDDHLGYTGSREGLTEDGCLRKFDTRTVVERVQHL